MAGRPTDKIDEPAGTGNVRWSIGLWAALLSVLGVALSAEMSRWRAGEATPGFNWWAGRSPDWLPFLPVLLLAIPLWLVRRSLWSGGQRWWSRFRGWGGESCPTTQQPVTRHEELRAFALSLLVGASGFLMSWHVGRQFGELPPAYHDEFSYLFQARTFLEGRIWLPSHPEMPELFNQMHVLNEGRFASRYFPGVGLWMAPFVALGNPWAGHWVGHAFASFLLFWIGRHLGNNLVGLVAGLLLAVSPGVSLFSNLLLAHHPTLVGLLVFLITFLKLARAIDEGTRRWVWALLAGCGLTYAMLCRPMTAAGAALPFGIWFGWWVLTGKESDSKPGFDGGQSRLQRADDFGNRVWTAAAMGAPIVLGLAGLFAYNRSITGSGFVTPYQQYTDIYTPRHVYGFNNVVRGEQRLGPKVLEHYDVWAENLTPLLAMKNVGRRISSSLAWTLGIVPLALAGIVFVLTIDHWNRDWWLTAGAIVSLYVVHVPYWFEGIMGWHYVFESAPFWLLLFAGVTRRLWQHWLATQRFGMPLWWSGLVAVSLAVNLFTAVPLWPARLDVGMAEVAFSRQRYAEFYSETERLTRGRKSLVLVNPDPVDRHIDYVVNGPRLDATILYGRYHPDATDIGRVVTAFPDRDVFLIDIASGEIEQLSRANTTDQ